MPLKIHFLNVGEGDCTIIEFPSGRLTLIDINNCKTLDADTKNEVLAAYRETSAVQLQASNSLVARVLGVLNEDKHVKEIEEKLTDPIAYMDHWMPNQHIFRMVVTHPDMDHMTGLHRLVTQTERRIFNFWHAGPEDFNLAATTAEEWDACRFDKRDWLTYNVLRASEATPKNLRLLAGATADYYTADGIQIWSPSPALVKRAVELQKPNIISMVLIITYAGQTVVLGGDATQEETWPDIVSRVKLPRVSVLKASHHGRKSGYHQEALKAMQPWLTVTSVGQKEHDATDQYRQYSEHVVSLRDSGDVRIVINDNGTWTYGPDLAPHWKNKKVPVQLRSPLQIPPWPR